MPFDSIVCRDLFGTGQMIFDKCCGVSLPLKQPLRYMSVVEDQVFHTLSKMGVPDDLLKSPHRFRTRS